MVSADGICTRVVKLQKKKKIGKRQLDTKGETIHETIHNTAHAK